MHRLPTRSKLHRDNRGSAIVLVIVVIAFIGMLLSMMMYMALYNYQMKAADIRAQNNFYSAETAMDEIRAGLKSKASAALTKSYMAVMQNYSLYTDTQRSARFQYTYFNFLAGQNDEADPQNSGLADSIAGHYSRQMLQNYITNADAARIDTGTDNRLDIYTDHITLENVCVKYTNPTNQNISMIETDINIMLPDMDFNQKLSLPEMVQYALIGNQSIQVTGGDTMITSANIYGGRHDPENDTNGDGIKDDQDISYGIQVRDGATLTVKNADAQVAAANYLLVSDDHVDIEGTGSALYTDKNTDLWAKGIDLDASSTSAHKNNLTLLGSSYIQDDLTVSGKNTSTVLGGAYYGYGQADGVPKDSSAILIDGTGTALDFSGLTKLALAGNAYIGMSNQKIISSVTSSGQTPETDGKDVSMGESMTAKAAQLAYLVPPECIGWTKDAEGNPGECILGKNPVSQNEYNNRYQSAYTSDRRMEVNLKETVAKLGKKLSDYGIDEADPYRVVVTQGTNWRYYYLNFVSGEDAGRFFRDYYAADYARMDSYIDNYVSSLTLSPSLLAVRGTNGSFRLDLAGNVIIPNSSYKAGAKIPKYTVLYDTADAERQRTNGVEFDMYGRTYDSLCRRLSTDYSSKTTKESTQDIFTNLIDAANVKAVLGSSSGVVYFTDAAGQNKAVVAGPGEALALSSIDSSVCLVIAQRDVVADRAYKGTIISGGQIRVTGGADITCDAGDVSAALSLTRDCNGKTYSVANLFTEGADMTAASAAENDSSSLPVIDTADLVKYSNWVKK